MNKYRVTKSSTSLYTFDVEAESESEAIQLASSGRGTLVGQGDLWSAVLTEQGEAFRPAGFGAYLRRISSSQADAETIANRCSAAGMNWVSLMVEANDGYIVPAASRKMYSDAFRALGIQVGVWSIPGNGRASTVEGSIAAARTLTDAAKEIGSTIVMIDVEAPYKGKSAQLNALVSEVIHTSPDLSTIGVASYPVPSLHADLDWSAFEPCDWGSPMFYASAQDPSLVSKGFSEWLTYVPTLVPSLDGWNGSGASGAERFRQDILNVCGPVPANVPGAIIWSEAQMDDAKRAVTREMGAEYGWPRGGV